MTGFAEAAASYREQAAMREMLRLAEMRWMSVEDAEITMKARDVALLGREVASLGRAGLLRR